MRNEDVYIIIMRGMTMSILLWW